MVCPSKESRIFQILVRVNLMHMHGAERGGTFSTRATQVRRMVRGISEISQQSHQALYRFLGVSLFDKPESYYANFVSPLSHELRSSYVAIRSYGALYVSLQNDSDTSHLPTLIRKSDGTSLYASLTWQLFVTVLAAKNIRKLFMSQMMVSQLILSRFFQLQTQWDGHRHLIHQIHSCIMLDMD